LAPESHLAVEIFRDWSKLNRFIIWDCTRHWL